MENKSNLTNEELNVIELSVNLENAYNKLEFKREPIKIYQDSSWIYKK